MTVKELIEKLNKIDDKNAIVHVGCQGYTSIDDPADEYEIRLHNIENGILISDVAYYGEYTK